MNDSGSHAARTAASFADASFKRSSLDRHIYLCGYRGSGKTSVGRELGRLIGRPVIDLDDRVEATAGKSIREIFAESGEAGFRDLESAELESIASNQPAGVVSLGGGAILRDRNRRVILSSGICVWLQADVDTVLHRLESDASTRDRRPSLTGLPNREEIESLLIAREPLYREIAVITIDTRGRSIEGLAAEIRASWTAICLESV